MKKLALGFLMLVSAAPFSSCAHAANRLLEGETLLEIEPAHAVWTIRPGTILVMGEIHDSVDHHDNQRRMLMELGKAFSAISVGFEFFEWPKQEQVDLFVTGKLEEPEFLKQVGWGKIPFDLYREQALFPAKNNGATLALNAPRALTSKISKSGVAGLSPEEQALMPPGFTLGSKHYEARFRETMAGHVPEDALMRYFEAQSVWDDTMAHRAMEFMRSHPEQVLVILVGDFHAAYGGGLPERLRARGASRVLTISQVNAEGLSADERQKLISPHPVYGPRGGFVWVTE